MRVKALKGQNAKSAWINLMAGGQEVKIPHFCGFLTKSQMTFTKIFFHILLKFNLQLNKLNPMFNTLTKCNKKRKSINISI